MAYADLRHFLSKLEEMGELRRVQQEVDWKYEIGAWTRYSDDLRPQGPALLFENIKGYPKGYRVLTDAVGSYRRLAIALEADPDMSKKDLIDLFRERLKTRLKPNLLSTGPVKENILKGDDIDLLKFPVPWWSPRDGGRFIGTWHGVVSKDPRTKEVNMGMYRVEVQGKNICTVGFLPGQHLGIHFAQKQLSREPLEVAVVIGADETIPIVSSSGIPYGLSEFEVAGGLRKEPISLVKCETVDLEVPANAEIVLEGKLYTDMEHRLPEGPFGEYLGYHGGSIRMRPILELSCIMHRNDPILRGSMGGRPTTEWAILYSVNGAAHGLNMFDQWGPAGVKAINNVVETGGVIVTIIQMSPFYVGHSREVARSWLTSQVGFGSKVVIVVDDDIDPFDLGQVFWAFGSRTQGSRDIEVWPFCKTSRSDPSVPRDRAEYTDRVIIDATKKLDYPYVKQYDGHWAPVAVPPKEIMDLVSLKWKKEFDEPVSEEEIERKQKEIEEVFHKKWEEWRRQHYELTEEEKQKELTISYPKLGGEME